MAGLQFYIELSESDPKVWRRIIVPFEYTFYKFHLAIQGAFGWENFHLFEFSENGFLDKVCYTELTDEDEYDPEFTKKNARKAKIKLVFTQDQKKFVYIYDFGDSWKHEIMLEKFVDEDIERPYCLEGGGSCPQEDCGGIRGYAEMLKSLNKPDHEERDSYIEWLRLAPEGKWDPNYFNIRDTNKRLCLLE